MIKLKNIIVVISQIDMIEQIIAEFFINLVDFIQRSEFTLITIVYSQNQFIQ